MRYIHSVVTLTDKWCYRSITEAGYCGCCLYVYVRWKRRRASIVVRGQQQDQTSEEHAETDSRRYHDHQVYITIHHTHHTASHVTSSSRTRPPRNMPRPTPDATTITRSTSPSTTHTTLPVTWPAVTWPAAGPDLQETCQDQLQTLPRSPGLHHHPPHTPHCQSLTINAGVRQMS